MLVACWSVKGGSGTTVVSAALALSVAATGHDALIQWIDQWISR